MAIMVSRAVPPRRLFTRILRRHLVCLVAESAVPRQAAVEQVATLQGIGSWVKYWLDARS